MACLSSMYIVLFSPSLSVYNTVFSLGDTLYIAYKYYFFIDVFSVLNIDIVFKILHSFCNSFFKVTYLITHDSSMLLGRKYGPLLYIKVECILTVEAHIFVVVLSWSFQANMKIHGNQKYFKKP